MKLGPLYTAALRKDFACDFGNAQRSLLFCLRDVINNWPEEDALARCKAIVALYNDVRREA